ncbi:MAG: hypothetical protein K2L37_01705, partial [Lactobacillus sp.]|nr:hypothetical protein [Lactobacillus sp.]
MTITTNADDGLGEFNDGYSYVYTDKNLIDDFRAGDPNTQYDLSAQKVAKTDSNRGTKENPYVIASVDDWETFAKRMGPTTSDRGLNKYFVLACDLDFAGRTFRPIPIFKGTFYGMGHKLLNITANASSWQYWTSTAWTPFGNITSAGFGIFGRTDSATITDLIVQDYYLTGMPNVVALVSSWGNYHGGLVGVVCGNDSILNCHLQGEINGGTTSYADYGWCGGIAGLLHNGLSSGNSTVMIYRCSANSVLVISSNANKAICVGGIIGDSNEGVNARIFDCVSYTNFTSVKQLGHISGVSGYFRESNRVLIEDVVTVLRTAYIMGTSTTAIYGGGGTSGVPKSLKNIYADAVVGTNGSLDSVHSRPTSSSNINIGP